jgi:hypothetical protein
MRCSWQRTFLRVIKSSQNPLGRFRRFRRLVWSRFFCHPGISGKEVLGLGRWPRLFTCLWRGIAPMLPITSLLRIPPVAPARAKMGRMSNRSSNRRELRVLGSFRNFAHREAVGSFRKSVVSALRLQSSVYEISEIGLNDHKMIAPCGRGSEERDEIAIRRHDCRRGTPGGARHKCSLHRVPHLAGTFIDGLDLAFPG